MTAIKKSLVGNFSNLQILTTPGALLHATPPMPTFTLWTGFTAPEVITKALAQGMTDLVPAAAPPQTWRYGISSALTVCSGHSPR